MPRRKYAVSLLGVGEVGKTTYIYRPLGLSGELRVRRKPRFYVLRVGDLASFCLTRLGNTRRRLCHFTTRLSKSTPYKST